jgi:hypothetical protein
VLLFFLERLINGWCQYGNFRSPINIEVGLVFVSITDDNRLISGQRLDRLKLLLELLMIVMVL